MTPTTQFISEMERLLYLKTLPMSGLDSATMSRFASRMTERTFSKGDVLLPPNAVPKRFFIVVDGEVEVTTAAGNVVTAGAQCLIGVLSALARDPRGVSAVARRKTLTLMGSVDFLLRLMDSNYLVARMALRGISEEMADLLIAGVTSGRCGPPSLPDMKVPGRRLDIIERVAVIRRHARIGTFNLDAIMELAHRVEEIRPQPGEIIWRQGEPARHLHIFAHGLVEGRVPGSGCFQVGCGHHLENFVALAGRNHVSNGLVMAPSVILKIAAESFYDILEDRNFMAGDLIALYARNLIDARAGASHPCDSF